MFFNSLPGTAATRMAKNTIFSLLFFAVIITLLALITSVPSGRAMGQTKYWIGNSAEFSDNSKWSLSSGGANNTTAPDPTDVAVFDGNSGAVMINSAIMVGGIEMRTGYSGAMSGFATVTVYGNFLLASGSYGGGNGLVDINGSFTQSGGNFTLPMNGMKVEGNFTISGGTFDSMGAGTLTFDSGTTTNLNINSALSLSALTINKTGGAAVNMTDSADVFTVTQMVTLTDGQLTGSGTLEVQNNLIHGSGFDGGTGTLLINGTATRTISLTGGGRMPKVTVNGANITLSGPGSGTVTFDGVFSISGGTFNASTGNYVFNGAYVQTGSATMNAGSVSSFAMNSSFSLVGTGTFTAPAGTWTVTGDFSHNADSSTSTLTHNNGTLVLNGANQTLAGTSTFYNLTKTVTAAATLTFPASTTTTILNTMTLQGASGQLLSLRSSVDGTSFRIDPQGVRTIDYLSVKDSHNLNATAIAYSSTSTYVSNNTNWITSNNTAPVVTLNSITSSTDGSGKINVSVNLTDADTNNVRLRVNYAQRIGSSCGDDETFAKATISATSGDTTNNFPPTPAVDNNNDYQLGSPNGFLTTGGNTVTFKWASASDAPTASGGYYCVQVIPYDGTAQGTALNNSITADNTAPAVPGNLTVSSSITTSLTLTFGAASSDTNFGNYKIFYKAGSSGVTTSNSVWNSTNDANLGSVNYGGATATTITGLAASTQYVFNIWAYDTFGNIRPATEVSSVTASAGSSRHSSGHEDDRPAEDSLLSQLNNLNSSGVCQSLNFRNLRTLGEVGTTIHQARQTQSTIQANRETLRTQLDFNNDGEFNVLDLMYFVTCSGQR